MKISIEQMEYFLMGMKNAQKEHPKAVIYFDFENKEIRITYPLPKDFHKLKYFTNPHE